MTPRCYSDKGQRENRRKETHERSPVLLRENDRVSGRQSQVFACRRFKIIHPVEREKKSERRNERADGVSVGKEGGMARRETEQKDKRER